MYFSKNWKAEIDYPKNQGITVWRQNNNSLSIIIQTPEKLVIQESTDNGITWTNPQNLNIKKNKQQTFNPIIKDGSFLGLISHQRISNGGQLFFHSHQYNKWEHLGEIRDTNWGNFVFSDFIVDAIGNFYCVFVDWRNGNADIYFSSSTDTGKTWSKNTRIDDDLSGQEQTHCRVLSTNDGVLYAFWQDNRNLRTLYDIYFSMSTDCGKTWSQNVKINDDTTHTWQIFPDAVLDTTGNIYVVWNDFREKNSSGDIISKIYFSKSIDQGDTWSNNIPIAIDEQKGSTWAQLTRLTDKSLHCIWGTPLEHPVIQLLHSYSLDNGATWSEPALINDDMSNSHHDYRTICILPDIKNNLYVGWSDWRNKGPNYYFAKLLQTLDSSRKVQIFKSDLVKKQTIKKIIFETDDTLYVSSFNSNTSNNWKEISGTWIIKDEMYIGFNSAISVIEKNISPNFSFTGQFLLDPLNHRIANICFQFEEKSSFITYYRLANLFRGRASLEYFDGNSFEYISELPYQFQKEQWYTFKVVVNNNLLNYFINDSLLISTENLKVNHGKVGLGTGFEPAYFKDILVLKINPSEAGK